MMENRVTTVAFEDGRLQINLHVVVDHSGAVTAYREKDTAAWIVLTDRLTDRMLSRLLSGFLTPLQATGFASAQCAKAVGAASQLLSGSGASCGLFDAAKQYLNAAPHIMLVEGGNHAQ